MAIKGELINMDADTLTTAIMTTSVVGIMVSALVMDRADRREDKRINEREAALAKATDAAFRADSERIERAELAVIDAEKRQLRGPWV